MYREEPWRGYAGQKRFAASLGRNDWVLILDADEECSPELAARLQALTDDEAAGHDVYSVPRRNYIFGRHARCWDPDWQSRVIHRDRVHWPEEVLHESRQASDPSRHGRLPGAYILHKRVSQRGWADYFSGSRLDARLLPVARQAYDRGKRCSWWTVLLRPWGAFLKLYILKGGWRDGTFGLLIAQKTALTTQLKYAALWAVQHGLAGEEGSHAKTQRREAGLVSRKDAKAQSDSDRRINGSQST